MPILNENAKNTYLSCLCLMLVSVAGQRADAQNQLPSDSPIRFAGQAVVLTTPTSGGHAFVSMTIGDSDPYSMIIDSGSSAGVLDVQLVQELGLEVVGQREALSGGVDPIMLDIVLVPHMQVGDLEIIDTEFLAAPLAQMTGGTSFGVIGMDIFSDVLVTFDIEGEQVIVSHGELSAGGEGVYKLSQSGAIADFELEIADRLISFHIDTGAPGGFTLPLAVAESIPLLDELRESGAATMVGGTRSTWLSQLDGNITLGGVNFQNPSLTFLDPAPSSGNLGNAILRQFIVTFDFRNGFVAFAPAVIDSNRRRVEHSASDAANPRRVGIQFGGMGALDLSTIGAVMPGSLAEHAGLRAADIIVSINGRAMNDYEMSELRELFGGSDPLNFQIERTGSPMAFVIE